MSLVRFRLWAFFAAQKQDSHFLPQQNPAESPVSYRKKTLHRIPGNSRMDTVQSSFRRITAPENISFLQIFDYLPCFIIKFSISEIVLFIFFGNLPNDFTRISCCNRPVRNVLCYNTSAADNNVISDMYTL